VNVERPTHARARALAAYAAVVVLAVGVRWPLVLSAACLDADATIVPLMARHFARGEFAPYYWGQRYMGALEPLLMTPLALFGLATLSASTLVALLLFLVQLVQVSRLARHVGAPASVAALLYAVPSAVAASYQMALWGARSAAQCLGLWALDRAFSGSLSSRRGAVFTGAILGFAFYGDHLTLAFALPVFYLAFRAGTQRPLLGGGAPFVLLDAVLAFTSAAGRHSLPQDPRDWLRGVRLLLSSALPRITGLEWLDPRLTLRPGPLWIACSLAGLAALALFVVLASRRLLEVGTDARPRALGLSVLLVLALHVVGALDEQSVRYLLIALGPFSVLVAWLSTQVSAPLAVALVVAILLPRVFSDARMLAYEVGRGPVCRAELSELEGRLQGLGVRAIWADYWDAYRLALASNEAWPVGLALRANRHPCWNYWARAESPVAYVAPSATHPIFAKVRAAAPAVRWIPVGHRFVAVLPSALPGLRGPEPERVPARCETEARTPTSP
jgi:hypothetical protein